MQLRFEEIESTCLMELAHAMKMHNVEKTAFATKHKLKTPVKMIADFREFLVGFPLVIYCAYSLGLQVCTTTGNDDATYCSSLTSQ